MTRPSASGRILAHANRTTDAEENRTMHMAVKARKWTRADLERLPYDGNKYEVIRGELFVTPPPEAEHESIVESVGRRIQPYVWAQKLGQVRFPRSVFVFEGSE